MKYKHQAYIFGTTHPPTKYQDTLKKVRESKYSDDPLENYKGKWCGLWFRKDGTTKLDMTTFDTEKECLSNINHVLPCNGWSVGFVDGTNIPANLVSHAIPIPVI